MAPKGAAAIGPLLRQLAHADIPDLARTLFAEIEEEYAALCARIAAIDARMRAWSAANPTAVRLQAIPGVGPRIAALLAMKTPDPHRFASMRDYAAWLGLTPKDHSTAGRQRLGCITRAGDPMLRSLLVVGATAIVWRVRGKMPAKGASARSEPGEAAAEAVASRLESWVRDLLARKSPKRVAVAIANKIARIAWVLMARGESYRQPGLSGLIPMQAAA